MWCENQMNCPPIVIPFLLSTQSWLEPYRWRIEHFIFYLFFKSIPSPLVLYSLHIPPYISDTIHNNHHDHIRQDSYFDCLEDLSLLMTDSRAEASITIKKGIRVLVDWTDSIFSKQSWSNLIQLDDKWGMSILLFGYIMVLSRITERI